MAYGSHVKKLLNRHNSATVGQITMKFGTKKHFYPLKPIDGQNFEFKKFKMAVGCHLIKLLNHHVSSVV